MLLRQFNSSGSPESIMKKNEKSNLLAPIMNKQKNTMTPEKPKKIL